MELRLGKKGLLPKYQDYPSYAPSFEWFNDEAQKAILNVGIGVFCWGREDDDKEHYIFPPSKRRLSHHEINAATLPRGSQ